MEIGVSTASLFGRLYNEDALIKLNELDARVVEVFLGTFSEYTTQFANLLLERKNNLKIHSIHTLNTHFEPQLFSLNPRALDDAMKIFEDVLRLSQIVGAKNYTMHGIAKLKKYSVFNDYARYGECFNAICDRCDKFGVELCLENVEWALYGEPTFFKKVKAYCPRLKGVLDVKQAKISGFDYHEYIEDMSNSINTAHLSDVDDNGKICLPGSGNFDFLELFRSLKESGFDGNMLIEVYKNSFVDINEISRSLEFLRELAYKVFA